MQSRIDALIEFSFKGETLTPSATLDLDKLMGASGSLPNIHLLLANENDIDTYSYLYEAMEVHPICFSNATGVAVACLAEGVFDIPKFERLWQENRVLFSLQLIAKQYMNIGELEQYPELKEALLAAYNTGKVDQICSE